MLELFTPRLLQKFLNIVYWLFIVTIGIIACSTLYTLLLSKEYHSLDFVGIPMVFKGIDVPVLNFGGGLLAENPEKLTAQLKFKNLQSLHHPLVYLQVLYTFSGLAAMMCMLAIARRFMRNIVDGEFFIPQNVDYLKWIGHLSFVMILLDVVLMIVVRIYLSHNRLLPDNVAYDSFSVFTYSIEALISVLVCYMLAGIFQYGMKLQTEQELTV